MVPSVLLFQLMALLLTTKTVTTYECFKCKSDPSCKSPKECEDSCNRSLKITSNPNHVCLNLSYSYIDDSELKYVYERKPEADVIVIHWGCRFHCEAPEHFNSTDCEISCCNADLCNGRMGTYKIFKSLLRSRDNTHIYPNLILTVVLISISSIYLTTWSKQQPGGN